MKALNNPDGTHAPEIQSAIDWLTNQGKDGNEHAVILDGETLQTKKHIDGTATCVTVSKFDCQPGDVFLHNHPCLNSLSNLDLYAAADMHVRAAYAISADGSVYRASNFYSSVNTLFCRWELAAMLNNRHITHELRSSGFPIDVEDDSPHRINSAHWLNKQLAREGGTFTYDYWLKEETQTIVNKIDNLLA